MAFKINHELPSPDVLKELIPMDEESKQKKAIRDEQIKDIFTGKSDKFILIVGPCSARLYGTAGGYGPKDPRGNADR